MKPGKTGFARIIDATKYSCQGLAAAWKHEAAFRQEVVLAAILIPIAFWLGETITEVAVLVLSVGLILLAELTNSAIEAVVDRFGGEIHELSGRAKDIGSALVFVALAFCTLVWALFIYQKFFS